jgi:hypothetical protein
LRSTGAARRAPTTGARADVAFGRSARHGELAFELLQYPQRDGDEQQLGEEHPVRERLGGVGRQEDHTRERIDAEAEPHDAIDVRQLERRQLAASEQPCVDADVDAASIASPNV